MLIDLNNTSTFYMLLSERGGMNVSIYVQAGTKNILTPKEQVEFRDFWWLGANFEDMESS